MARMAAVSEQRVSEQRVSAQRGSEQNVSQQALFEAEPAGGGTAEELSRLALDDTSWVEVRRGWLAPDHAAALYAHLAAQAPWAQRTRWMYDRRVDEPRLTAEYLDLRAAQSPLLEKTAQALSAAYGVPYDGVWLNLYRNGDDSTSWHGDRFTCRRPECIVPVLSLGATRRFLLRPREGGRSIPVTVGDGDLVVMGGRCQRDWRHCVPKMRGVPDPRISVNFTSTVQRAHEGR